MVPFRTRLIRFALMLACSLALGVTLTPLTNAFSLIGSAWDPGPGTARIGGFPAPGAATWSIMAAGVVDSLLDDHAPVGAGNPATTALSALYAGGVSEAATIDITLNKWAAVSAFTNLGSVLDGGGSFGLPAAAGISFFC